ncbi:DMT family transporter [Zhengella mangrovi]|uniref:DMT family transporter n=1 Tax=Zhengella mangrovi TaxID=1982044 RepID=UPI00268B0BBB
MVIIRLMSRSDAPTTILSWQAIGVGLATALPAIWFWKWPTATEWLLLAAMGVTAFATQMSNIIAYKWGEASLLASLDYIRLLYATLLGWLFFSALPHRFTLAGAAIIVLASIYTIWRERQRKQELTRSVHGRDLSA